MGGPFAAQYPAEAAELVALEECETLREALRGVAVLDQAGAFKQYEGEPWLRRVREAAAAFLAPVPAPPPAVPVPGAFHRDGANICRADGTIVAQIYNYEGIDDDALEAYGDLLAGAPALHAALVDAYSTEADPEDLRPWAVAAGPLLEGLDHWRWYTKKLAALPAKPATPTQFPGLAGVLADVLLDMATVFPGQTVKEFLTGSAAVGRARTELAKLRASSPP